MHRRTCGGDLSTYGPLAAAPLGDAELPLDAALTLAQARLRTLTTAGRVAHAEVEWAPSLVSASGATLEDVVRDRASQRLVALACCRSAQGRAWCAERESVLFRERLLVVLSRAIDYDDEVVWTCIADDPLFVQTLHGCPVTLAPVSDDDEKDPSSLSLACSWLVPKGSGAHVRIIQLSSFLGVAPLLRKRRAVVLCRGAAVARADEFVCQVLTALFRRSLLLRLEELDATERTAVRLDLEPFLDHLHSLVVTEAIKAKTSTSTSSAGLVAPNTATSARLTLANLWPRVDGHHFPPCAQHIAHTLRSSGYLKREARQQLGLFLKAAGLSLEEALEFWRVELRRGLAAKGTAAAVAVDTDRLFDQTHRYNIRHMYGEEGKRVEGKAHSCARLVSLPLDGGAGGPHGCPFRTLPHATLLRLGFVGVEETNTTTESASPQETCRRHFVRLHPHAPPSLAFQGFHPVQFYQASIDAHVRANSVDKGTTTTS